MHNVNRPHPILSVMEALLDDIRDPRASPTLIRRKTEDFVNALFASHTPLLACDAPPAFGFRAGFDKLFETLRSRIPDQSPWDFTKGSLGYGGSFFHLIITNLILPDFLFAKRVTRVFVREWDRDKIAVVDYCLSPEVLRDLTPIIYELHAIEPGYLDYYRETGIQ